MISKTHQVQASDSVLQLLHRPLTALRLLLLVHDHLGWPATVRLLLGLVLALVASGTVSHLGRQF